MKIAIAMSGGIDSTMAALLLQQEGHEIVGITVKMFPPKDPDGLNLHHEDARQIADKFGFEHHVINITEFFDAQVIRPFCNEYLQGRTPNPCIICNPLVKFKTLLGFAEQQGCAKLATGHYASTASITSGRYYIRAAHDLSRDQSYFLSMLPQDYIKRIMFPLGSYTKTKIRELAQERGVHIARKSDSQEICFIPDNDYAAYITQVTGCEPSPGDIVDKNGTVIGRHNGIHRYTIGQRRGLGISAPYPLYVTAIDARNNRIIAGYKEELQRVSLLARNINYMKATTLHDRDAIVKCRSTQPGSTARLKETPQGIMVYFNEPQYGISPGQAAVFYDTNSDILGAGIIEKNNQ